MKRLDPSIVRQQIDALFVQYPELREDEVLRADMFEGETSLIECLRELERKRRDSATMATAIDAYIDELTCRRDRFRRRDQAVRAVMFRIMEWAELTKCELPEATLSVRGGQAKVIIFDDALIPDIYCRIKREPDKVKIKAALSEFKTIPGASLSNAESVLAVRTK